MHTLKVDMHTHIRTHTYIYSLIHSHPIPTCPIDVGADPGIAFLHHQWSRKPRVRLSAWIMIGYFFRFKECMTYMCAHVICALAFIDKSTCLRPLWGQSQAFWLVESKIQPPIGYHAYIPCFDWLLWNPLNQSYFWGYLKYVYGNNI